YSESMPMGTTTLQNSYGCDSIVSVILTFYDADITNIMEAHCAGIGYSIMVGSDIYDENMPTGTTNLVNMYGCDSIVNVNLAFTTPNLFTAPFADMGTTIGMGNSCDPTPDLPSGSAEDALYEIVIPNDGTWAFSLAGSDYDTQLFLGTSCCMNDIAENDDEISPSVLTSKIIIDITAGTYFLTIDGWNGAIGNYNLEVYEVLCEVPTTFTATWIDETAATYDWNDVVDATSYEIQERIQGETTWQTATVTMSESSNIITHTSNTTYQWQVRTLCSNGFYSDWSPIHSFYSRAVLSATFTNVEDEGCPSSNDGEFMVTVAGGLSPFQYSLNGGAYASTNLFTGLSAGTYVASVIDAANDTVDVINTIDGSTEIVIQYGVYSIACEYCSSEGNNSSFDHIGTVDFNTIYNESGDDNGYGNYTNLSTDVVRGNTYDISLTPIINFVGDVEFWNVWIDYNQDFTFSNDELALQTDGSEFMVDSMITIPPTAMAGTTMMRIQMMWNENAATACDTIPFGEVEDYTIMIHETLNATVSNIEHAKCPNGDEGSFQLNIVGGLPPYTYSIDNGGTFQVVDTPIIENISAGTYQVFVQDVEGTLITATAPDGLNYFDIQDGQPSFACNYCHSEGQVTDFEYIQLVHFEDIDHSSGNDNGYGDFTNISTTVMAGNTYDITLTPFVNLLEGFEYWSVWIDYNGDYVFSADELALQTEGTLDIVNASIAIPSDAVAGTTMMRVQMKWGENPTPIDACQIFEFGEVEDYSIVIEQVCDVPTGLNVLDPTPSTATFDWNDMPDAVGYNFRQRIMGASNWTSINLTMSETSNLITHTSGTTYEWQVQADCGNGNISEWSALETFVSPTADCAALSSTNLNSIITTSNGLEVTLEWMSMPNAQAYQLAGRKVGGNTKVFPETQLTSRTFTSGINYNTSYQWSVRVKCDGVWTDYALPPGTFTTPQAPSKHQADGFDIFDTNETLATNIYPNPTKTQVTISVDAIAWEKDINIAILDMTGRLLMEENTTMTETTLDISHLTEGFYLVKTENAGAIATTKLVIIK
ncbi:MAG: GEVED domain-containing protein, partial [Chitinophagales bacterium]